MKQNLVTIAIVAMAVISVMAVVGTSSLVSTVLAQQPNPKNVTICHIPPGNPDNRETMIVDASAVAAYVRDYGDYIGACQSLSSD
jgi:hypothetical protein